VLMLVLDSSLQPKNRVIPPKIEVFKKLRLDNAII
jgi:hypothetical protein